jgi:hypothetical protein
MEIPNDPKRVFGIISPRGPNNSDARVKVLGFVGNTMEEISKEIRLRIFPPSGYIRAYRLFDEYDDLEEGDMIQLQCELNEKAQPNWDIYRMIGKPRKMGFVVVPIKNFINNYSHIDLSRINIEDTDKKGTIYGLASDKYIIGKFRLNDGQISCDAGHVYMWDKGDCRLITDEGKYYLLEQPTGESRTLDCLTEDRLFEWFREKLRSLNPQWVQVFDEKTFWRKDIPALMQASTEPELDKNRMERLDKKFQWVQCSITQLEQIIENSDQFKKAFLSNLEIYKHEFLEKYYDDLQQLEEEKKKKEKKYSDELDKIQRKIKEANISLTKIEKQVANNQQKLDHWNSNKDRLLVDFSILTDLIGSSRESSPPSPSLEKEYVLEEVLPGPESVLFNRDQLINRLKYHFRLYQLNEDMASHTFGSLMLHRGLFVSDIKIALALARAFGQTKYIIQQVGPDWLHFRCLWKKGLGELWESAHAYPQVLHLLILQDLNLSSPECYARPLLDLLTGVRTKIPFGQSSYPSNLKILATKASTKKPSIGLPLFQQTFVGWGHIGFSYSMVKSFGEKDYGQLIEGYGDAQQLEQLFPEQFETKMILVENQTLAPDLFDEPC